LTPDLGVTAGDGFVVAAGTQSATVAVAGALNALPASVT
jgi:hypothetical protein